MAESFDRPERDSGPSPLLNSRSVEEIQADLDRKRAEKQQRPEGQEQLISSLATYIRDKWIIAQNAKASTIEPRLERCKRAIRMEYEPRKLTAIRSVYGKEFEPPYRPIILGKYRDFIAWVEDYLCREDVDIWDITPTPLPDLPGNMNAQIQGDAIAEAITMFTSTMYQPGQQIPAEAILNYAEQLQPKLKDKAMRQIKNLAKDAVDRMKQRMKDQLAEGGFEKAKKEAISDLGMYPNAFIQGPIITKVRVQRRVLNEATGRWETTIEDKITETWRRVSPWAVYPQPNATCIENGYVFILDNSTPTDLSALIGVPGYDTRAVRQILAQYRDGGLKEWTNVEAIRAHLEDRDNSVGVEGDKIDKLEFQGSASGRMLKDWAGSSDGATGIFGDDLDDDKEYPIVAWLIGDKVIKAMLNEDPMGHKNLHEASIIDDPDNFWSPSSLPEMLLNSVQNPANAAAVALVYNTGISAGPMMEYNKDRFPDGVQPNFFPGAKWPSTGPQMQSEKVVNFYNAPFNGDKMIMLDEHYMQLADLYSGIPRHTNDGPKETATAVSIKSTQASQGLKSALVKWDVGIMTPLLNRLYQYDLQFEDDIDLIGDCTIVAKGAQSVIVKEQLALRRTEYADKVFSNQFRMQLLGPKGLRELEKANAMPLDMDLDKLFGEDDLMAELQPIQPGMPGVTSPVQTTQPAPAAVPKPDGAGDAQSGQDFAVAGEVA